jgi:hypothetical protein
MACGGQCVDTLTSAANCGGCGSSCTGGTCKNGVCALVNNPDGGAVPAVGDFSCIAIDTQNIYVATGLIAANGGQIYKVPLNGGAPQTIVPMQARPHGIASDGKNLYWTNYGAGGTTGSIMKSGIDGSNPTPIAPMQASPFDLSLDATHVFWTNRGDGTVWQANKDGSNPVRLAMGLGATLGALNYITNGAGMVYFGDRTAGVVYSAPVGGTATMFASPGGAPVGVAVDATELFWSDATRGTIIAKGLKAGSTAAPIAMTQSNPNDVVTDGTSVYWSNAGMAVNAGSINKVAATGGMAIPLASGQNFPGCIAIDATSIYWINTGGGAISKTGR